MLLHNTCDYFFKEESLGAFEKLTFFRYETNLNLKNGFIFLGNLFFTAPEGSLKVFDVILNV